ncbi:type II toxin-antitoxin system VapC family toxin [Jiella avicenniae]|uniref:Type II toxin-antitoxin system VapC family toxin n=1 Tax=Jiella avicenniae TaxID=2907202 RepID=A0A9X1T4M1_9HYPH|nr:type II toxin-antitoxin system VapC family toxin [Jiella avicenniae]MCE7027894.1 type II toxin-antitoxin system VapC family toxin [Jiella avicenniae]
MPGVLLDTHTFYWLASGTKSLTDEALVAIGESQSAGMLYVSAITAWELSIAAQKPRHSDTPQLNTTISEWFASAKRATNAKTLSINQTIAIEAAEVPVATGHKDPGDCYLVATSRVQKIPLITRDKVLRKLARSEYLEVIVC